MGAPFLIIDGYNLLHAAGLARLRYGPGDLDRARFRMLGMLCEKLTADEQSRCTVVFDARNSPSDIPRDVMHHGLRVLFAPANSDADTEIEFLISTHSAPRRLTVVSSDHRLQQAAKRRGATPIDSDRYWDQLRHRPDARHLDTNTTTPPTGKPVEASAATADWLQEFGNVSIADLAAEVRAEGQTPVGGSAWERHLADLEQTLEDPEQQRKFLQGDDIPPPRPH